MIRMVLACCALGIGTGALAAPIPPEIEAMLRAAKPKELGPVVAVAKRAAPGSKKEIAALAAEIRAAREAAEAEAMAEQGVFEGWSGEGALGGSISTGNTEERGVSASLGLGKRTRRWEHDINLSFDYLVTNGTTRRERIFAGYTGKLDIAGPTYFSFGLLSFERDRFSGIEHRFTESLGLGTRLVDSERLTWSVEGGPALRQTAFTDGRDVNKIDLLGRTDIEWKPSDRLTLTERAGFLMSLGGDNSSLFSKTAVTADLIGALSARLSFDVLHETEPPSGREKTDTITRASLVYDF